jgi:indolepyruvate decarboxylase
MPLASDVGDCLFTAMDIEQTELVAPGYYATMGYGVPAGLGVQVATGKRPVILVGDGAFQMTGWELGNAARLGCDPIVLVFNNASWEMLRTFEPNGRFNDLSPGTLPPWPPAWAATGRWCARATNWWRPGPGAPRVGASSCWTSAWRRACCRPRWRVSSRP